MSHCNICGQSVEHAIHCPEYPERKYRAKIKSLEIENSGLAAEVAMLRDALESCHWKDDEVYFNRSKVAEALSLPTNHAAILAQRDARTLRDAAEKLETTPCMSGLDFAIELSHMAAELEAGAGKESGK